MKNILIVAVLVTLALLSLSFVGCGQEAADSGSSDMPTMAYNFRDGAPKFYDEQKTCPVCGGEPIKEGIYATYQGKRVYFDKEECATKFEESPEQYINEWMERVREEEKRQAQEMQNQ